MIQVTGSDPAPLLEVLYYGLIAVCWYLTLKMAYMFGHAAATVECLQKNSKDRK